VISASGLRVKKTALDDTTKLQKAASGEYRNELKEAKKLDEVIVVVQPGLIAFEAPLVPTAT
jgi:hypothetical protein